ncbi:MAG: hypothetical protein IJX76_05305 [Clostridia bacterium]|nr:hypothetical protein [Clostridia bacterium]
MISTETVLTAALVGGVMASIAFVAYQAVKEARIKRNKALYELTRELENQPTPVAVNAVVLSKSFKSRVEGTRSPRQVSEYTVTFRTEDGETAEYAVPQEIFMTIEEGQESTLVTIDGQFFDFSDGEDTPKEDAE